MKKCAPISNKTGRAARRKDYCSQHTKGIKLVRHSFKDKDYFVFLYVPKLIRIFRMCK